ncbi:MAG: hypothetical protein WAR57_06750, partial [Candidatus Phosphoribacter sp.]
PTADAAAPSTVTLRLLDPIGRAVERTVAVPGFVATPAYVLEVVTATSTRVGVVLAVACNASTAASAGLVLAVRGVSRRPGPIVPFPGPRPRPTRVSGTFPLAAIRTGPPTFPTDGAIHVTRPPRSASWPREARYAVFVPIISPVDITLDLLGSAGEQLATVSARV